MGGVEIKEFKTLKPSMVSPLGSFKVKTFDSSLKSGVQKPHLPQLHIVYLENLLKTMTLKWSRQFIAVDTTQYFYNDK